MYIRTLSMRLKPINVLYTTGSERIRTSKTETSETTPRIRTALSRRLASGNQAFLRTPAR